jgi:hypothetical protein
LVRPRRIALFLSIKRSLQNISRTVVITSVLKREIFFNYFIELIQRGFSITSTQQLVRVTEVTKAPIENPKMLMDIRKI